MAKEKSPKRQRNAEEPDSQPGLCSSLFSTIFWSLWTLLAIVTIAYISFGLLMLYSTQMKMEVIFMNRLNQPFFANLSNCNEFGIVKCENIVLDGGQGKIGAWMISPSTDQYITKEAYILYLHGNMGSRALAHRVEMYKKLSRMGYHILTIDYRGFGDSDGSPTEFGLLEDAKIGYKYLKERAHGHATYIWGHSLGSAVGVQLAAWLNTENSRLNGLILEAPFNNMFDGIKHSHLAAPVIPFIPNFDSYIEDVKEVFKSDYWIKKVFSSTLILHDVSDHILNIKLARKLYFSAKETGSSNVHMIELNEKLYHNDIYKAKHFIKYIEEFMEHTG